MPYYTLLRVRSILPVIAQARLAQSLLPADEEEASLLLGGLLAGIS